MFSHFFSNLEQHIGFPHCWGKWFFNQYMLASLQGLQCKINMSIIGSIDYYQFYSRVIYELVYRIVADDVGIFFLSIFLGTLHDPS
ncbi:Uncharacterised protein [Mycobacterium tuberculosis]|nr:Uncharacterised protein [Mycobacterium tuberculosis]